MSEIRCNLTVGTDGDYPIDCNAPAVVRYRSSSDTFGPWRGRCAEHARILDPRHCTIESLR